MSEKEKLMQFIAQKSFEKWANENQDFIKDYRSLLEEMVMFEARWGVQIKPYIQPYQQKKGRDFGKGDLSAQEIYPSDNQ